MTRDEIMLLIEDLLGMSPKMQGNIIDTVSILAAFIVVRFLLIHLINRRVEDVRTAYQARKVTTYTITAITMIVLIQTWFRGIEHLATVLGLASAGIAVALKDPIANLAGRFYIAFQKPFHVGDRIQVGTHAGDVIDLRLFQFSLMEIGNWVQSDQSTGRVVRVPNSTVFREPVANYSEGFDYIWDEIPVLVTFETDWRKAKEILTEIADKYAAPLSESASRQVQQAARRFMIFYSKLTPIVYTSTRANGVLLTIRYLCNPRSRRTSQHTIWEAILDAFSRHKDIDFAYPTTRYYDNAAEGKLGLTPGGKRG